DHANICTIYDIDETDDGSLFIAMAYYEGENLKKKMHNAPLSLSQVVDLASQIATGLSKAHELQIIHRDVKPPNLIVTKDGTVKIVDFGLAKLSGVTDVSKGAVFGTAAYMSPEQAQGFEVDPRPDIWSCGVVLVEMLSGQLPFLGDNYLSLFNSIVHKDPQPLTTCRSDLSAEFDRVVTRALEKQPDKRYRTILEAAEDLQKAFRTLDLSEL